jgi:hypothetical protein
MGKGCGATARVYGGALSKRIYSIAGIGVNIGVPTNSFALRSEE